MLLVRHASISHDLHTVSILGTRTVYIYMLVFTRCACMYNSPRKGFVALRVRQPFHSMQVFSYIASWMDHARAMRRCLRGGQPHTLKRLV